MASIAEEQKHANDEDKTLADEIVVKSGYLQKLGGGDGGRQNWKKRFFVYKTKTLEYYENEKVCMFVDVFVCVLMFDVSLLVCWQQWWLFVYLHALVFFFFFSLFFFLLTFSFSLLFLSLSIFFLFYFFLCRFVFLSLQNQNQPQDHTAGKKYKGVIVLDCYYAAQNETKGQDAEFSIYAYPKNMTCRGSSPQEMNVRNYSLYSQ